MIELRDRQIVIDGEPRLLVGGEVHYFRLKPEEWEDRILKLKEAGCNVVGSYIPWLCHEPLERQFDLEGSTRPQLDLGGFIDLCKAHGLYFFARPGPFVMAELKNEGLPYWVYDKHLEIVPITWDGKVVPTRTVDYLAPGFLQEVRHWYEAVMRVIVPRLHTNGGNVIAVQLDNEIGMLSWITNSPDLTDTVLGDFSAWLRKQYDAKTLHERYPFVPDDGQIRNPQVLGVLRFANSGPIQAFRNPQEPYVAELMRDLGHYMRDRFARYVAILRSYAEEFGVRDVPFVINVHGTEAKRAVSFPVGISQLYESYTQAPGYVAGSDHYIGDLTTNNFADLYLLNAYMAAANNPDQPLTSVEFECGSGDYATRPGGHYDPSTVDFKTRMCVAQGNRLLNYYLFTGGINYHLDRPVHDGNDRISFTGERHGVGAPVNPEGRLSYTYPRMARSVKTLMAVGDKLAAMEEEHDNVAWAFIPDYYMTESHYPPSDKMSEIVENLRLNRGEHAWDNLARAMLLSCFRFGALNIQDGPLEPQSTPVLVLASARYMDGALQSKLVKYLEAGGCIFLYGEIPLFDMEGKPCTRLVDALGLKPAGFRRSEHYYYLSVCAQDWAAPRPEVRVDFAQCFEAAGEEVLLRVAGTDEACGFDISVGRGRVIAFTTHYPCDVPLFRAALERLGATPALGHDCPEDGIFITSCASKEGERFVHILNLDGFDKCIHLTEKGENLFDGYPIMLRSRDGVMLPLNVSLGEVRIVYSTAEITNVASDAMEFRLTQDQDVIVMETERQIVPSDDYDFAREGRVTRVISLSSKAERMTLRWK